MATIQRFYLQGQEVPPPIEAVKPPGETGIVVEGIFGDEKVQPEISPLEFTFANEGAKAVRDYVSAGNIFQGMDWTAEVVGDAGIAQMIDGYLDLTDGYEEMNDVMVKVKAKFKASRLSLEEQATSITLELLLLIGEFTEDDWVDVEYVVEKPTSPVELAVIKIALFLMFKELAEATEKLAEDISTILGMTGTGATGGVGGTIYQVAIAVVRAAYIATLIISIIDMIEDIIGNFISPVRIQKGFTYRRILEVGYTYLGYDGIDSNIPELDNFVYVPSIQAKPNLTAVPAAGDYGYNFAEIVNLVHSQFGAISAVFDNVVYIRNEFDPFWIRNSNYTMPDVLLDQENPKKYNTDEMVKARIVRYELDDLDNWTLDNYQGTQYTVNVLHTSEVDRQVSGLKGFEYIQFPICLGNRKDDLNEVETALRIMADAADIVLSTFGSGKRLAPLITRRVGMVKISHEQTSRPKCIYLSGGRMPINHRDLTSAKTLWDKYINVKSLVANDFKRQRSEYEGVLIPFGLSDYLLTTNNGYFTTSLGKIGKFVINKWDSNNDQAVIDFWIEEKYSDKLQEIGNEQI